MRSQWRRASSLVHHWRSGRTRPQVPSLGVSHVLELVLHSTGLPPGLGPSGGSRSTVIRQRTAQVTHKRLRTISSSLRHPIARSGSGL